MDSPTITPTAPALFVVGCERSGTTLLRTMLDMNPQLAMTPESYFPVEWLRPHVRTALERGGLDTDQLLQRLGEHGWFGRWQLPLADIKKQWQSAPPRDVPAALRGVYQAYADHERKPRVGDKTPAFVGHLPLLATAFGQARFVHIVRDGRAVAMSLIERQQPPNRLADAALYWSRQVTSARATGATIPDRYQEIRYEDLLDDPQAALRRVCRFLDLTYTDTMLSYQSRAAEVAATFDRPEVQANLARPLTKGLRDWQQLPEQDIALMDRIAGKALRAHGYPVETDHPRAIALRAAGLGGLELARWRVTRSYRMVERAFQRRSEREQALDVSPGPTPAQ